MKIKVLFFVVCLVLATGFCFSIPWVYDSGIGRTGAQNHYCDVDNTAGRGQLWVTNYGNPWGVPPGTPDAAVYDLNTEIETVISSGLLNNGAAGIYYSPGGVAYDPIENLIYTITRDGDSVTADNQPYMFKYIPSTLAPVNGCDLTNIITVSWPEDVPNPGDIDVFTSGTKSYVVFVNKIAAQWGIFDPNLPTAIWSPVFPGNPYGAPGWHVNRGISCTPDGSMVLIADTDGFKVTRWDRQLNNSYVQGTDFATLLGAPAACEMDDYFPLGGELHVLISQWDISTLLIKKASDGTTVDTISPNALTPEWIDCRGAHYSNGTNNLYICVFDNTYKAIAKYTDAASGVGDWIKY
jgi:hypothetical protein